MTDNPWTLPTTWRWARFDEVARVASNLVDPRAFLDSPHIAPNHIESETGRLLPYGTVREDGVTSAKHRFFRGQVLYSKIRPYLAKVIVADFEGLCSADMYPIESALDPRFLKWWMLTREFTRRAAGEQARTVLPKINVRALSTLPVPIPPESEQRRIVEILEDHLSRLDAGSRTLETVVVRSVALRSVGRRQLFGRLEQECGLTPLLTVSEIANGQTPRGVLDLVHPDPLSDSIPYFKVGDMNFGDGRWMGRARNYISPKDAASIGLALRPAGTVLIPKRGGAIATNKKRILREAGCIDLNTMGLVAGAKLDSGYLWHWLVSVDLASIADGSNVPQINATQIRNLSLPLPPMSAQRAVAAELEELDMGSSRVGVAAQTGVRRGSQLRRAMLEAAFSGRLPR